MDDTISRQAAIDAVYGRIRQIGYENNPLVLSIRQAIRELPTAKPQRKKGKWIKENCRGQAYKCSACGNYLDFRGVNAGRGDANFCPNCGADMRGERDG